MILNVSMMLPYYNNIISYINMEQKSFLSKLARSQTLAINEEYKAIS